MGCALTQGFNLDCRDAVGGVKEVYIIETGNIATITEASGVVTAIALKPGKRFYKYSLLRETSSFSETNTTSEANGSGYADQSGEIILNKRQSSVRSEIMTMARVNLTIIVVENTGKAWLYGREHGMVLGSAVGTSGTAWGDRNGYTLPFAGKEKQLAPILHADVLQALQTPSGNDMTYTDEQIAQLANDLSFNPADSTIEVTKGDGTQVAVLSLNVQLDEIKETARQEGYTQGYNQYPVDNPPSGALLNVLFFKNSLSQGIQVLAGENNSDPVLMTVPAGGVAAFKVSDYPNVQTFGFKNTAPAGSFHTIVYNIDAGFQDDSGSNHNTIGVFLVIEAAQFANYTTYVEFKQ